MPKNRGQETKMGKNTEVIVVYDGDCPFCRNYCKMVKLREAVGTLTLVDARRPSEIMQHITNLGLDIDQGMVVKINHRIYYGSEAIHILSRISSSSDFFNRLNIMFFASKQLSHIIYPLLRSCRNFSLWLLNIPKIHNLNNRAEP